MKLGYIDYLNCYPFYFHMFEKEAITGVQIVSGYPSDLNRLMGSGEIDMSPISAAMCAELDGQVVLLPDFCLSSVGYVGSVVLRSRVPIEDLQGRIIGITRASHTSELLLKMLLHRYYNVEPVYQTTDPSPKLRELDAALVIGNEAMIGTDEPVSYSYDLGELWLRKTGFPVVFAVFAVRESALEKYSAEVHKIVQSYRDSLECLSSEREVLMAGARDRYPQVIYDIDAYYKCLQFQFSDELKSALRFYFDTAAEVGLIKNQVQLKYL